MIFSRFVWLSAFHMSFVLLQGAGDSFIGALGYFLAKHKDLDFGECIRRANAIAAKSVQSPGTQNSYPWKKDLPGALFQ